MEALGILGLWLVGLLGFPRPASAQLPTSHTLLYLLSGPDLLYVATAPNFSVTILTESPVTVTIRLSHGDANLSERTVTIPGGFTEIITLPPVDGEWLSPSGLVLLTLSGLLGGQWIFSHYTWLPVSRRSVSSSVQTDRARYRPGQTVWVRVASLWLDNRPYEGPVDISVLDPGGSVAQRWDSQGSYLGIVSEEFLLPQSSALGQWTVMTTIHFGNSHSIPFTYWLPTDLTNEKVFMVDSDTPPFDVLLMTAPQVLVGADISGTVRAQPLRGRTVHGTLSVTVTRTSPSKTNGQQSVVIDKKIGDSAHFFFSKDLLASLYEPDGGDLTLNITASVTEVSTGFNVKRVVAVEALRDVFQLQFRDFPPVLKPSLSFSAKLEISRYDRRPLSPVNLNALVVVIQKTPGAADQTETAVRPVGKEGDVLIQLTLQAQVQELIIHATFSTSKKTLRLSSESPSARSYVQIQYRSDLQAQVGWPLEMTVEASFQLTRLYYVVSSRGQVLTGGMVVASSNLSLTPMVPWFPEVCVTVYCVLPDGEVASDTLLVPIQQPNHVSLKWSEDRVKPWDQVSLTVTVRDPSSRVLLLVTSGTAEAQLPLVDWLSNRETVCSAVVRSDGRPLGPVSPGHAAMEEHSFQEVDQGYPIPWLYLDINVSGSTWVSPFFNVPHGVSSWRAEALVMSGDRGVGFSPSPGAAPQRLSVSQRDLTLSMNVPESVVRGEEIVLELYVFNWLQWDVEVIVLVEQSEAFEFVLSVEGDISVVNVRKVTVGRQSSVAALFPIRPLAPGLMEVTAAILSAESSESLVQTVLVKPEGVERFFSQTLFIEMVGLAPDTDQGSRDASFFFPLDVVPGSQRVHVAVVGDMVALSMGHLETLVDLPRACGEQNLVAFATSVSVLKYLDFLKIRNGPIRTRALAILEEGYQTELSYQRDDGSFSAFGPQDSSGSTWLTAFVLRSFLQAQPYILVEQGVMLRAARWLAMNQRPPGDFPEVGLVVRTEMRRCRDDCPVALTAFVLLALLEDETYADMYEATISRAVAYLEGTDLAHTGNYTLCLMAYALTLANRPMAVSALDRLQRNTADFTVNFIDGRGRESDGTGARRAGAEWQWQARATEVEMVSYVLLTLYPQGRLIQAIPLMKWLSRQRNHLGGFGSTQDTVVAIQALALYATLSGASSIELSIRMNTSLTEDVSHFRINSSTYLLYQSVEIVTDRDVFIHLDMKGKGFALFQMNVFYNVRSPGAPLDGPEAFSLDVLVLDNQSDPDHMVLSICTGVLQGIDGVTETGMAMVEVVLLSGFILAPDAAAAAPVSPIMRVESAAGRVSLYLDSITVVPVCITLPLVRRSMVAHVQDATVQVYDYYEPGRGAIRAYNSKVMQAMDSCSFCGTDCSRCQVGISIVGSPATSLHCVCSTPYSLVCVFAVMTLLLAFT